MSSRTMIGSMYDRGHVALKNGVISYKKARYAKKRVKMINGGYNGSEKEFNEIVGKYWKQFGIHPKKYWYDIYCDGKDAYDPRFVPDSMWYRYILPYYNNLIMRRAYTDKGIYNRLFPEVKKPETIVKNIAGYFYNGDGDSLITREEALNLCRKEEHLIIKPSLDSGGGRSIAFWDKKDDSHSIDDLLEMFGTSFVVQRIVKQHPNLARIHKESVNTIRVLSFHYKDDIHILSSQLRMGAGEARIDNISAGGCACAIKQNGWLEERAVTRKSIWTDHHESGILFKDIQIPNYSGILSCVRQMHRLLPYFNIVGWDFAVGEDEKPIFMEFNVMPEPNQIGSGKPTFGNLSDEVFADVFFNKTLKNVFD